MIRTWEFDPVMVPGVIVAWVFYVALAVAPFLIVFYWDKPPLPVGVVAGLFGFGVLMAVLVEGSAGRLSASMSRESGDLLHTFGIVSVIRAILAISWLIATVGVWGSAVENARQHAEAVLRFDLEPCSAAELAELRNA